MFWWIMIATSLICVVTGLVVLKMGDWSKFALKFAGVGLATLCSGWMLIMLLSKYAPNCSSDTLQCLQWQVYGAARNIAFIIFIISVGRDAIRVKNHDRRRNIVGYRLSAVTGGMQNGRRNSKAS